MAEKKVPKIELGTPGNWHDAICSRCRKPLRMYISHGLMGPTPNKDDGTDYFQPQVSPCLYCLENAEIKGRSNALAELYEFRTERDY